MREVGEEGVAGGSRVGGYEHREARKADTEDVGDKEINAMGASSRL